MCRSPKRLRHELYIAAAERLAFLLPPREASGPPKTRAAHEGLRGRVAAHPHARCRAGRGCVGCKPGDRVKSIPHDQLGRVTFPITGGL